MLKYTTKLKMMLARILFHPVIGHAVTRLSHGWVPCGVSGMRMCVDDPRVELRIRAALFWGRYEIAEIALAEKYVTPDLNVVELGTSLGVLACHVARRLGPAKKYVGVESGATVAELARLNLARNAPLADASVLTAGISYHGKPVAGFYADLPSQGGAVIAEPIPGSTSVPVRAITLSDVLDEAEITGGYALLCDIEGDEVALLLNEKTALLRCRALVIELHDTPRCSALQLDKHIQEALDMRRVGQNGAVRAYVRP